MPVTNKQNICPARTSTEAKTHPLNHLNAHIRSTPKPQLYGDYCVTYCKHPIINHTGCSWNITRVLFPLLVCVCRSTHCGDVHGTDVAFPCGTWCSFEKFHCNSDRSLLNTSCKSYGFPLCEKESRKNSPKFGKNLGVLNCLTRCLSCLSSKTHSDSCNWAETSLSKTMCETLVAENCCVQDYLAYPRSFVKFMVYVPIPNQTRLTEGKGQRKVSGLFPEKSSQNLKVMVAEMHCLF